MELKDTEIIDQILKGDKEKYALLIAKFNQRLYRICKGYLKDEAEIEDVMQEAYIKAFQGLKSFEKKSQWSTWITRILINECLQRLRKTNLSVPLEESEKESEVMNLTDSYNPEMKSINNELKQMLERTISELPERYRIVFIMREVEQMSIEETSEVLNITSSNVKVRLNRAKEMLRKLLMKNYSLQEVFEFNLIRCGRIATNVLKRI